MTSTHDFERETLQRAEDQIDEQSKRIEFWVVEFTLEFLAEKLRRGEFEIPAYQREYTWEPERKSRFIESILMGLPIPFLFFWEMPNGNLEIVDGVQRLRTIEEFLHGGLRLGELESLPLVSRFSYADLFESRQRKLRNRTIRGVVLNEHADEQARLDMFERINTGSKIANKAELRRGALRGPFLDLVIELADSQQFIALAPVSDKQRREREREELVTRFFAYGDGLGDYHDRPAQFLYDYSKRMNSVFSSSGDISESYRDRFVETMNFVARVFPYGFRRSQKGNATRRARFEAIAVGSYLALQHNPALLCREPINVVEWLEGKEFGEITRSDGANAIGRLRHRIEFVRDQLLAK